MKNIENPDSNVKQLLQSLGFAEDGGYDPSFEKYVRITPDEKENQVKLTSGSCLELVSSTIKGLEHRYERLTGQAAVTRYLTAMGTSILEKMPGFKAQRELRRLAWERGNELDRLLINDRQYDFAKRISVTTKQITVYSREWVGAQINKLATDIGLEHISTMTQMALIAGIATSREWVPKRYVDLMLHELLVFAQWLDNLGNEEEK